jgi:hypothetical protein
MAGHGGAPDPTAVANLAHSANHSRALAAILAELRADVMDIAVGDFTGQQLQLSNFPVSGSKRVVVMRTGNGNPSFAVPVTPVLVLPFNEGRLGGVIVNTGATAVTLFLTQNSVDADNPLQALAGVPAIWLAASGGSWDFRLGNVMWAGSVTAQASVSPSTLTIAEV